MCVRQQYEGPADIATQPAAPPTIANRIAPPTVTQPDGAAARVPALLGVDHARLVAPRLLPKRLALHLLDHVLDDVAVLALGTEHDDLCVSVDLHVVPWRPVE
jgi:hypothetical protein